MADVLGIASEEAYPYRGVSDYCRTDIPHAAKFSNVRPLETMITLKTQILEGRLRLLPCGHPAGCQVLQCGPLDSAPKHSTVGWMCEGVVAGLGHQQTKWSVCTLQAERT